MAATGYADINNTTNVTLPLDGGLDLEEHNTRQLHFLLPAIVYSALLMAVGTPGNAVVLYVYFFRWRKSTSRMFILFLTALDFVNCVTTLPMEIFIMRYSVMLDMPWLCKASRFLTYTMNSSSAAILVGIAVDRFRRICRPHGSQFTARSSRCICICAILLALTLSWPALVMYGTRTIPLGDVVGKACHLENRFDTSFYPHIFFIVMTISTLIIFATLSVLYYFVGIQVYKHGAFRKKRLERIKHPLVEKSSTRSNSANLLRGTPTVDVTDTDGDSDKPLNPIPNKPADSACGTGRFVGNMVKENGTINGTTPITSTSTDDGIMLRSNPIHATAEQDATGMPEHLTNGVERQPLCEETRDVGIQSGGTELKSIQADENNTNDNTHKTSKWKSPIGKREILRRDSSSKALTQCIHVRIRVGKSTLMLFLITIAYIVSFLPFYSIAIMRQTYKSFVSQLSDAGYMAYHLFLRSYLLSSAINPIIYSFCNSRFRTFCFDLCKKRGRKSKNALL